MARIGTQTNIQLFSCHVSLKSTNNQKYNLKYRSHFHTPHEFDECHGRCLSDANTHKIADIVWYHQGGATGRWHANFCLTPFFNIQFSSNDLVRQSLTKNIMAPECHLNGENFSWFRRIIIFKIWTLKNSSFQKQQQKTNNCKCMVFISVKIVLENEKGFGANSGMIKETLET